MSLKSTILFSMSVVFLIIGLHQTFVNGIASSYFLYMFSILFLLLFVNRKKKESEEAQKASSPPSKSTNSKTVKRKK